MDLTRYDKLRSTIRRTLSPDEAAADRALEYAAEHTALQVRHDGSPMLDHAAEVARIGLEEIGLGGDSVVAAILHDVVRTASRQDEETFLRLTDEIRDRFGKEVLGMTVSLSHISDIRLKASREQAENFRELIVFLFGRSARDPDQAGRPARGDAPPRNFPREKWRKKSWESLNLYAQIAHKLGLYNIKSELEDIALRYLEPQDYQHIADKLAETESERRAFIARFLEPITQRLDQAGLRYHVKSRTKSIFSIWNKMRKQHVPFEGVYDIFAIRIILDCPLEEEKQQCWTVYSIVTDFYTPNPERMRDWISIPKSNGYESLHHRRHQRGTVGRNPDPHRADGRRGGAGHRGPLALQRRKRGIGRERNVDETTPGANGRQDPSAGPELRRQALLGRNFRLHPPAATCASCPKEPRCWISPSTSTPRWGSPARAARSITVRRRSATYSTTETSSKC